MDKETEIKAKLFDFIYANYEWLFLTDESLAVRSENAFATMVYIQGAFDVIDEMQKKLGKCQDFQDLK